LLIFLTLILGTSINHLFYMQTKSILILLFYFVFQSLFGQNTNKIEKRIYTTKFIKDQSSPVIDGLIDDKAWDIVDWTSDFVEREPDENTPPSEQTKFKILYDDKFLYFAFRCYDKSPKDIVKRLSRRDGFEGDWVEVNIDSYNDKRTGFSFTSSVSGVKGDEFISLNGNNWDGSWNPIWYLKTSIDEEGWIAEVKIPFSQLKFGNLENQIWGIQVQRRFFRAEERSVWQRIPQDAPGWVSEFGELHGLSGIEPQKQLEIQPFITAQAQTYEKEEENPYRTGKDEKLNGGLDAKIGITNDLTLDLTINPDFGQVEADPAAIALDGFQIFFREQRPFFVENKNIFDFTFADGADNVFYSRRIGRNPQGFANAAANEFVSTPSNTTILGAAKFSGKTKNGWSLGLLETITDKEYAKITDGTSTRKELVEPLTNYFIARAQKDFNNRNSFFGAIITATNRNLENGVLDFLHKGAFSGGIDFEHNWKNRKYFLSGNFVTSHVVGSKEAIFRTQNSLTHLFQRVDASHVEVDPDKTSLSGTGGRIQIGKSGEGHWRYRGSVMWRSPELELNDVGFLRQADEIKQTGNIFYQTLKPFGSFRRLTFGFNQFSAFDFEGNFNRLQMAVNTNMNFKNNWNLNAEIVYKPFIYSNTILRGGPRFRFSEEVFKYVNFGSDSRKKFRYNFGVYHSQGKENSFSYIEFDGGFAYQPFNALTFSFNPNYSINKNKTQYVTESSFGAQARYITANISQNTLSATLRLDYSINPNLTIQYYGQPFISRGLYNSFNRITDPIAKKYKDRVGFYTADQISFDTNQNLVLFDENRDGIVDYQIWNPDFSEVQFRSNLVVRWEYIPGSELFLVWSQGLNGSANTKDNLFSALDNQLLDKKPENIFLLKWTYRFVL
jgi:Domain of unknown function (DUF5916)/Carbohydrate family 9 binding domain-like